MRNAVFLLGLTPLNLPEGETSDSCTNQHQRVSPLLWRGWGGQNTWNSNYDIILFSELRKLRVES